MILRTEDALVRYLRTFNKERFTFDTETSQTRKGSALSYMGLTLCGVSLYDGINPPAYVEMNFSGTYKVKEPDPDYPRRKRDVVKEYTHTKGIDREVALAHLRPVFQDAKVTAHNAKYDGKVAKKFDFFNYELEHDTMLMSYVLDCNSPNGLKESTNRELKHKMTTFEEAVGQKPGNINWTTVDFDVFGQYACDDAYWTHQLREHFLPKIEAHNVGIPYYQLEIPNVEVLIDMETLGVEVDVEVLNDIAKEIRQQQGIVREKIFEEAGVEFNINSSKQLGEILFDRLGCPVISTTAKGARSTDDATMKELAYMGYDIAEWLSEYSKLEKILTGYAEGIPKMIDSDGRLRGSFNQAGTATGRFSSSNPNLQNQPNNEDFPIRQAFKARKGYGLIVCDWSTIEIRVMAHLSQDPVLIDILRNNRDIHQETATRISAVVAGLTVTRSQGKTLNFGVLYGMGADKLAYTLNTDLKKQVMKGKLTQQEYDERKLTKQQAQAIIDGYYKAYKGYKAWSDAMVDKASRNKFVRTFTGRVRPLPEFNNKKEYYSAARKTVNTAIQGGAGDLMKRNMVRLFKMFLEENLDAKLLMVVHDEFVIEAKLSKIHKIAKRVQWCMETVWPTCSVPIKAEVQCLRTWGGMKGHSGYIKKANYFTKLIKNRYGRLPVRGKTRIQ